ALLRWIPPGNRNLPESAAEAPDEAPGGATTVLPEMPGIDTADGIARMTGNVGAYLRLLSKFADNQENTVAEIRKAVERGDTETATRLAHTLKGVAGNISAASLQQVGHALEAVLKEGKTEKLEDLMTSAAQELERVIATIRTVRQQPSPAASGTSSFADVLPGLHKLRDLLTQYDSEAEDLLSDILGQVSDPAVLASLKVVQGQLTRDDFDGAVVTLDSLMGKLA
ncbi:MAG: Hpt domain-containing protein, partial [Alphaproteobacteria bacterium]|nr:Hpt domain-containing protein [Alphaproteobacteria bacterium]